MILNILRYLNADIVLLHLVSHLELTFIREKNLVSIKLGHNKIPSACCIYLIKPGNMLN